MQASRPQLGSTERVADEQNNEHIQTTAKKPQGIAALRREVEDEEVSSQE